MRIGLERRDGLSKEWRDTDLKCSNTLGSSGRVKDRVVHWIRTVVDGAECCKSDWNV